VRRNSATISVSLPAKMADELERVRHKEHRTRSEFVREALRRYMQAAGAQSLKQQIAELREEDPAADEIAAIKEGSEEIAEGKFVTFEQLRDELDRRRQQPARRNLKRVPTADRERIMAALDAMRTDSLSRDPGSHRRLVHCSK
jgi:Arc/MetJ-type ribon-helix-helix transcriptional regulator